MKKAFGYNVINANKSGITPGTVAIGVGLTLTAMAAFVKYKTNQAKKEDPPQGKFTLVDGVKIHYMEKGTGDTLVLIHGNGTMAADYQISTLFEEAAKSYRVIAIDRPGYGYSNRPSGTNWDATAQADIIYKTLKALEVVNPIVVGHSWGTLVALSLALEHPKYVRSLVLLSGYYYPTVRLDVAISAPMAIPVIGHILRYTISPILGRITWPLAVRKLFIPSNQPARFKENFPVWMSMRPSQLQASAADGVMMIPEAFRLRGRYHELQMPVTIMAGSGDLLALSKLHSEQLHEDIQHSKLLLASQVGHMIHHVVPEKVLGAIDMMAADVPAILKESSTERALKVA